MSVSIQNSDIDCSRVYVTQSSFSTPDNKFKGAFANQDISKGELVEKGLVRRLSDNTNKQFDGMNNPYVVTWSDDVPNYTWGFFSGCATFYNSDKEDKSNTNMVRYFDEDRFEIYAKNDIKKGEELTHTYKSLEWRTVVKPLSNYLSHK